MESSSGALRAPDSARETVHLDAGDGDVLLTRAAQSIAASGRAHTVVDVLHGRAFNHYRHGLREYLAIRLGDLAEAEIALKRLRGIVAAHGSEELVVAPGIRARMYRLARDVAAEIVRTRRTDDDDDEFDVVVEMPWRSPREANEEDLQRLRGALGEKDAELLELRHARELRPIEIAFVLDVDIEVAFDMLTEANERAKALCTGDAPLRRTLLEAFALEGTRQTGEELEEAQAGPSLMTGVCIGGRYVVQARVGTGAFGDVYRAEDAAVPGHVVALKLLHEGSFSGTARQTALRELRHIASVFHPSVVQFKDHGWHDGRLWFVMPWYDGETLESRLQRKPLSRAEARRIFEPLARALAAIHAAGIRHQDIKPENVFLAELGKNADEGKGGILPVLIDLGVAATEAEMLVAGTPTYFAPEVAAQFATVERKPRVTAAADVFSLALTLRNALEPSTQEDVPAGAVESFIEERARQRPRLPSGRSLAFLGSSLERWMSLDPDKRPSAEELADELAVLTRPEDRRKQRGRMLRWTLPLVAILGAIFGGVLVHMRAQAEAEQQTVQSRLAEVRQDLEATDAERAAILARYADMELTGEELRERLAAAEAEGDVVARALATARSKATEREARVEQLRERLSRSRQSLEQERADAAASAERARLALEAASAREHAARDATTRARGDLATAERELTRTREQATALETQVATTAARLSAAQTQVEALEQTVQAAIAERQRLERAQTRAARPAEASVTRSEEVIPTADPTPAPRIESSTPSGAPDWTIE